MKLSLLWLSPNNFTKTKINVLWVNQGYTHTLSKYACSSAGFSGLAAGAPTEAGFGTEAGDWTLMVLGVGSDVEGAGDATM